ncbi:MAG: hypothetical protein KJ069_14940 [Anaerolineae bacterium]|nr:hypothetical protein [Anaerolineae bacterium]
MKLFDQFERTDHEPAKYGDSIFAFINRTARDGFDQVRHELESWFTHYPRQEQRELRARFRSNIDTQHHSAFFELILHETLLLLGCNIVVHPTIPGTEKRPDFLVEPMSGEPFYLEALVATKESAAEAAARSRVNTVYDVINRKVNTSDFFLWLEVEGVPQTQPPASKIATFLNERLSHLDPDEVMTLYEIGGMDAIPSWLFECDGWVIEFQPIPKKPGARNKKTARPIGALSTDFQKMDLSSPIRDAISKKANKYGELSFPFVVAVNVLEHIDEIDIMEALFGRGQFTIDCTQISSSKLVNSEMSRIPDGLWTSYAGPRNTRVSAVLLATQLFPFSIPHADVRLYHNPWVSKPYSSVLTRLPQAVPEANRMKKVDGDSLASVLSLPVS